MNIMKTVECREGGRVSNLTNKILAKKRSIQCMKLTIPYSFNQIPPFVFRNAHVTSAKHTGLVSFKHWSEIFAPRNSDKNMHSSSRIES